MKKIYDCFQFFNELDILEIRLNELDSEVDHFVIVEAELSHQLKPKPLYFLENRERFNKFLDKIIHVVVPGSDFYSPDVQNYAHHNDTKQRDSLLRGIGNANSDDLIIISDLDEIVSSKALNFVKNNWTNEPLIFEQNLYYWYLNTRANGYMWRNAGICTKEMINNLPSGTRSFKDNKTYQSFRRVVNGGWHFSYMGSYQHVKNKLDNFAHTEFGHLTSDELKVFRERLTDPLGRTNEGINLVIDPINTMPVYVQNNIEKFKDYIR